MSTRLTKLDKFDNVLAGPRVLPAATVRAAQLTVARNATSKADMRFLLDNLGLLVDPAIRVVDVPLEGFGAMVVGGPRAGWAT